MVSTHANPSKFPNDQNNLPEMEGKTAFFSKKKLQERKKVFVFSLTP